MPEKKIEDVLEAALAHATVLTALVQALLQSHPDRSLFRDGQLVMERMFIEQFEHYRVKALYDGQSESLCEVLDAMRDKAIDDIRAAALK